MLSYLCIPVKRLIFFSPKIFGPNEDEALDVDITRRLFEELTAKISAEKGIKMTPEEVASGFLRVANEAMSRPIRTYVLFIYMVSLLSFIISYST